ncbi:lytic murein transglycosylase [Allosphingosinicella deserti]|uniref:Lytic murein transglycosylase n=1 Tax=Allosphingosinicella deserti TaxID=2116704 RepID=A0A2P7QHG6_9SPHN|nr:lytic murein transglycosylase [Sphingomonas deserti]PSJ37421.1 lytic murein transglycosylase [Sphingomonas deserti]
MRILIKSAAAALAFALPLGGSAVTPAFAQTGGYTSAGFQTYLPELRAQALREGVSRRTVDQVFPTLVFSARTIELDQAQPGGTSGSVSTPPFAPYRQRHVNPALISGGARRYAQNLPRLQEIGRRYGVTPSVLVAIWGHETSYGAVTGDFDLLNSLATLSYEGRRRALFSSEFVAALKMIDRGVPRSRLKGSWAGATGYPQFLPSVYLRVAADGDGDGHADIWQSQADALASIANYLSNAGWKPNTPWGVAVRVPAGFDRSALRSRVTSPRCQRVHERHTRWITVAEWRRMGIVLEGSAWPRDTELASLLEPDGPGQTAYLLTTNYRTILDYNCSNFYALSVGLLADAVSR